MSGRQSQDAPRELDWALATLEAAGLAVIALLLPGEPENTIARTVKEQAIAMLVVGAFGRSPLRTLLFGSKTDDLLRSSTIPTLLMR